MLFISPVANSSPQSVHTHAVRPMEKSTEYQLYSRPNILYDAVYANKLELHQARQEKNRQALELHKRNTAELIRQKQLQMRLAAAFQTWIMNQNQLI